MSDGGIARCNTGRTTDDGKAFPGDDWQMKIGPAHGGSGDVF